MRILAALLLFTVFTHYSCKKKKTEEVLIFNYTFPAVAFQAGDSASYGSSVDGWNYLDFEVMDNKDLLSILSEKKIASVDVSSAILSSCVLTITSGDSTFNMFDSLAVKVGGTFNNQGAVFVSAYADELVAEIGNYTKSASRTIGLNPLNANCSGMLAVDDKVAFRIKLYSAQPELIYFPTTNMNAVLRFTITGTSKH